MKKILIAMALGLVSFPVSSQTVETGQPRVRTFSLAQLKDSALHNNIAIRNARHNIEAAGEQRSEAFTKYFPQVSGTGAWYNANKSLVSADINPSELIPQSLGTILAQSLPAEAMAELASPVHIGLLKNGLLGGITAVQPVFAGGQIVNGNRLARVGEEASRLELQLSENEVERTTEQYYWQVVTLQEKMNTLARVEALLADICKDVTVAVNAGVALRNDLLQVQLRQNEVESQKLKLQNGLSVVKLLLAQYCGLDGQPYEVEGYDKGTSGLDGALALDVPHSSRLELLPEYQLLQKNVEATRLQERMEQGKNLPTVGVGVGYNYNNLMDKDMTVGMVFATVNIPISDWWGGSHAVKRKRIEMRKAKEQLADNSELLMIRMRKAWNDVQEAQSQLAIAQRSIEQSEENLRLHRDFYQAGTATMSDLLEAQLLYQQALDLHTDAVADLHVKTLAYKQATGQ